MATVPTTRRLQLLIPVALVAGVVGIMGIQHRSSDPVQIAHDRFGAAAVVTPNAHRPVAAMIASADGLTPPSAAAPADIAKEFVVANQDVLGLELPDTRSTTASSPSSLPTTVPITVPITRPVPEPTLPIVLPDAAADTRPCELEPCELRRGETLDGQWFRYEQTVSGVPVYGGDIVVTVNDSGQVVSSAVKSAAPLTNEPQFSVTPTDAQQVAIDVAVKRTGLNPSDLAVTTAQPVWFDPTVLAPDIDRTAGAAYQVNVTRAHDVDFEILVDANQGVPALVIDRIESVAPRICDGSNTAGANLTCTASNAAVAPATSSVAEVATAYQLAVDTSNFFANRLSRNSYDGAGSPLVATVRACEKTPCPMVNAFWSNGQAVFGDKFAVDDIVGHEFTHGVIESTAGLMYYGQSGAINESIADIFGELIDHTTTVGGNDAASQNWLIGEGVTSIARPIRNMADPSLRYHPDKMTSTHYWGFSSDNYGVHTNSGVLNKAAYLIDAGGTFNGYTVAGLGDVLTAKLFYQALTSTLVPGSDYADLAVALPQACQQLVAVSIATQTQCQSVTQAVAATEMAKPPSAGAATLTAPTCDTGTAVSPALFSDDAESGLGKWTTSSSVTSAAWTSGTRASQSGSHSFYGPDVAQPADASLRLANPVALPLVNTAAGDKLFVRFDHTFSFESDDTPANFDGGVVEYEVNGNGIWQDVKALPSVNGYNGVLANPSSPANPLAGRNAFVAISPGFQTTRIDLTSLAGQSIKMRFRIGSDNFVGDYGWNVDDVRIYRCSTSSATTTAPTTAPTTTAATTTIPTTTLAPTTTPSTIAGTVVPTVPGTIAGSNGAGSTGATINEGAQRGPGIQVG